MKFPEIWEQRNKEFGELFPPLMICIKARNVTGKSEEMA